MVRTRTKQLRMSFPVFQRKIFSKQEGGGKQEVSLMVLQDCTKSKDPDEKESFITKSTLIVKVGTYTDKYPLTFNKYPNIFYPQGMKCIVTYCSYQNGKGRIGKHLYHVMNSELVTTILWLACQSLSAFGSNKAGQDNDTYSINELNTLLTRMNQVSGSHFTKIFKSQTILVLKCGLSKVALE